MNRYTISFRMNMSAITRSPHSQLFSNRHLRLTATLAKRLTCLLHRSLLGSLHAIHFVPHALSFPVSIHLPGGGDKKWVDDLAF